MKLLALIASQTPPTTFSTRSHVPLSKKTRLKEASHNSINIAIFEKFANGHGLKYSTSNSDDNFRSQVL